MLNADALRNLHAMATEVRNECHAAYEGALRNRKSDHDSAVEAAWQALTKANNLRDRLYNMLLDSVV